MLKKLFQNKGDILGIAFLIFGLISIRLFEEKLFYDPFLNYFREQSATLKFPKSNLFLLIVNLFFRYCANTFFSLAILWIIFKDKSLLRFTSFLYLLFFFILIIGFFVVLFFFDNSGKMVLFYIRRFLIQPLFLLLFIPAFYFQKGNSK